MDRSGIGHGSNNPHSQNSPSPRTSQSSDSYRKYSPSNPDPRDPPPWSRNLNPLCRQARSHPGPGLTSIDGEKAAWRRLGWIERAMNAPLITSFLLFPIKPCCDREFGQIDFQITVSQPRTLSSTQNLTPPLLAISMLTGPEILRVFAIWRSKG